MSGFLSQLGVKRETTYGTEVVVDRFVEYDSEGIAPTVDRLESKSNRASSRAQVATRWVPLVKGGAGPTVFPVLTKGFGVFLEPMLGAVATGVANADGRRDHTGTIASLKDKSATVQVNKVFEDGSASPFTGRGGKIVGWKLSCDLHGKLVCELTWDFQKVTTTTGLATASYVTGAEIMAFVGGSLTVAGSAVDVRGGVEVTGSNAQRVENYPGNSLSKRQPLENDLRGLEWAMKFFWDSMAQYNRVISDTRAGAQAAVVLTFRGPSAIAGSSFPELVVSIPNARFDGDTPAVGGPDLLELPVKGVGMNTEGANDMVSLVYKSADATP